MSLVEKIPPLISALAFGYGVGMTAPDHALEGMQGAVAGYRATNSSGQTQPMGSRPYQPVALSLDQRLPGAESAALTELRATGAASRHGELAMSRDLGPGYTRDARRSSRVYEEDLEGEADDFESVEGAALSRLQLPEFGLGVSRQTLKYVRFFTKTDRGRGMFESWLKRSGRYQELVQEELRQRKLPEDLIWVAMIESGFDPTAKSPAGAVGLWQFMPATGAVYGLKQNKFIDQRKNPRLATLAAAHHLRDLHQRFGQWDLALAAYNMGYEQLLDRIDQVGTTDFNELVRAGALPSETSKYVPKIVAAAIVANNLERFGFDEVKVASPTDVGEIAVPPRTPLELVAKAAGVSTSTIRKLNPDFLSRELPPGRGDFLVNVPSDTISRSIAALPTMIERDRVTIDPGDDIVDPVDLMSPDGYRPRPVSADDGSDGSLLAFLPKPKQRKRRSFRDPLEDEFGEAMGGVADVSARLKDLQDVEPEARTKRETLMYRVGPGDTLAGIAREFAADAEDVARDNGLGVGDRVKEGSLLKLKVRREMLDEGSRKNGTAHERLDGGSAKRPGKG